MGKIGAGLGTFSMMGKMVSFAPLYNSMASIASSIAKAKAEAAKQQKKAEETAQAKIDDFIISDKNQYTQKYLPYAQQSFAELVTNIQDDKTNYPNTWMNRVSTRILQAKDKLNWAMEQSTVQRDIEKKAEEGFMVPQELLAAYKQNPGDVSDIATMAPALNMYGITVSGNGAISHTLSKPVEIGDDFFKFKRDRAVYGEPSITITAKASTDGSKFDEVRTQRDITAASLTNYKTEAVGNKDIRTTFKTRRLNEVSAEYDKLLAAQKASPTATQYSDSQLIEMATTNAINNAIDAMPKSDITTSMSRESKGVTVNVGGDKYVQPEEAGYIADMVTGYDKNSGRPVAPAYSQAILQKIEQGGGAYVFTDPKDDKTYVYKNENGKAVAYPATKQEVLAFNAQLAHTRRGTQPDKISQFQDLQTQKVFLPGTMERIPTSDISRVFKEGTIIDYFYIDNKVYAQINIELKSGVSNVPISLQGQTEFLVEVPKGRKLDGAGATLATKIKGKKYASMYDYFNDIAPSGGAAQPSGTGASQSNSSNNMPSTPSYGTGGLSPE